MVEHAGLQEPLGRTLLKTLRLTVFEHAARERRFQFTPLIHVGVPGGDEVVAAASGDDAADHATRSDIVAAMLRRFGSQRRALVWLTRAGDATETHDLDLAWLAAAQQACGELGRDLVFVVVDRHRWHDPRSGARREWKRPRPR
jgi:hypothetical protein